VLHYLQLLRRLLEEVLRTGIGGPMHRLALGLRFFTQVGIGFYQDRCFLMASTLAFSSAFALVPISTFFFSIFAAFPKFKELIEKARLFVIAQTMPDSSMRDEIIRYLNELTNRQMDITSISVISLVFTSVMLFITLEDSLNTVFVVRHPPPLQRSLVTYTNLLFWGPLFLALSTYLWLTSSDRFQALTSMALSEPGHLFVTLLASWVMFASAYWLLPYGNTTMVSSLLGGLIAAALWEVAKKGFGIYLLNAFTYSALYGAVGFIPVTLLWIYTSCLIFLFGAKVSFCYQFRDMLDMLGHESESDPVLVTRATLASLLVIGRRFRAGEPPPSIYQLSREVKAPSYLLQKGLMILEQHRILHAVTRRRDTFLPARSLESITLKEVFWATFTDTPTLRGTRAESRFADRIVDQAREAIGQVLRDRTIAQVLEDPILWRELTGRTTPPEARPEPAPAGQPRPEATA
jgi:membrane protein